MISKKLARYQGTTRGIIMDKSIATLLDGYQQPAILSNADDGCIVFLNKAAKKKFNVAEKLPNGTTFRDLFHTQAAFQQRIIWERQDKQFEVSEENLRINGREYIQAIIKPLDNTAMAFNALDLQQEMAKRLVHRFHSPINGISGFTELLREQNLTPRQDQYMQAIDDALDDLKQVLSSISTLAQDIEPQATTFTVQHFTEEVLKHYNPTDRSRITLDIDLQELHADFVLLKSAVIELLDNALKFSDDSDQKIAFHIHNDGSIRITSYGDPIPETHLKKIFYPFFSTEARGIGLGLAKCIYFMQPLGYAVSLSNNSREHGISFELRPVA